MRLIQSIQDRLKSKVDTEAEIEVERDPAVVSKTAKDLEYFIEKGFCVINELPDINASTQSD